MIPEKLLNQLDQSPSYQTLLKKVEQLIEQHSDRLIIAIAGLPGSGKSTMADYISQRLKQQHCEQVISVSLDGFHYSKAQLKRFADPEAAFARRGAPWTFDSAQFCLRLAQFKQQPQQTLYWPSFDHSHGDPIENDIRITSDTKVLIVEGLYVLHQKHGFEKAQAWIDESWYIDLDIDTAMLQLAKRHQQAWGISETEARQRIAQNDALNAQIADQSRVFADHIIRVG
ncbi:Pantothenate kinase [Marinomonas aquimarina]|uniref:Pantothenate kinase n=1 Tax=Marinomonas aquimarina TaxID=295068 RepID=A0A1A8SZG1_9GAMM|nr:hypothetical protein [Marinomonas aquimarina]SBS24576.1 Pantothenate kinase [Marinomonas aquimarina]